VSTIQLPGLLTGIDTATLIAQLMAVERRTLNMYEGRKSAWEEKKDALSSLESKLEALRTSVRALSNSNELRAFTVASSDSDILTAEASYNAFEGNHTVVINQLANAERWVHTNGKEYAEDYVGAGTFIYSYNHQETVLTTTATTTLQDLAGLINNDANNPGVTANLLYYNDTYHLVLNGNDPGSDYQTSINASNTEVRQAESAFTVANDNATLTSRIIDLDQFDGTFVGDEYITISGKRHDGTLVSQNFAINENTKVGHLIEEINDAFGGTATATLVNGQIRLTDHTCDTSQMELIVTYNPGSGSTTFSMPTISRLTRGGSVTADLAGFASADFTETQSAQDCQFKVDGYPTGVSEWFQRSSNTVDDVIHGVTLHLHDTGTIQVNLTRDIESVKEKLNALVTAYNAAVVDIQEKTGYNDALKTAGVLMGDYVVSTIRSQLYTPLITQTSGFVEDIDTFLTPAHIGIELDRDGLLSLDTADFDKAIAEDYADVLSVIGANKTGSSDSNTIEFYGASTNYTTAGTYDVEVVVSGGAITSARIKLSTESTYRDATYSGNIVTGNSSFDENGDAVYPENGLQLSVDLSQDGTFTAAVRVKQGFAGAIEDALDRMLKLTTGSIQIDQEHTGDAIKELQKKIELEEERLTKREERLIARFARLERTLALIQQQMSALGFNISA
jgi:flagellar hook-associated protein 2